MTAGYMRVIWAAGLLGVFSVSAVAQETKLEDRLRKLEKSQQALQKQIMSMKEQLLADKIDQKVAAESNRIRLNLEYKDGFKISSRDGAFKFQIGGRVHADTRVHLDDDDPKRGEGQDTFLIRRARIFAKGTLYKYYDWKFSADFAGTSGVLKDGWVNLHYVDWIQLKSGQFYVPWGMEELDWSSNYRVINENSMTTRYHVPDRGVGMQLHGKLWDKRLMYYAGVFNGTGANKSDENDDKDYAARIVVRPFALSESYWLKGLQLGAAVTGGHQTGTRSGGPKTVAGTRAWRFKSGVVEDDNRKRYGLEMAWFVGSFGLMGEYHKMIEDLRLDGIADAEAVSQGYYITAFYWLTGEKAGFGRPHPLKNFDPHDKDSGPGAWQIGARFDQIETGKNLSHFVDGARGAYQLSAGLNWYPNPMVRLGLTYSHAVFRAPIDDTKAEDALLFRIQITY